jgi:pseudouridine synthase
MPRLSTRSPKKNSPQARNRPSGKRSEAKSTREKRPREKLEVPKDLKKQLRRRPARTEAPLSRKNTSEQVTQDLAQGSQRLQKVLSRAGVASRRKAELWMELGYVEVNGKKATELGTKVDPNRDEIRVQGQRIYTHQDKITVALNKPREFLCTMKDPHGRRTVVDLVKSLPERLYPVGRLDYQSEGLLLMTNDGDLAHKVMHPSHQVAKTYLVKIKRLPKNDELEKIRKGVFLEEGFVQPAKCEPVQILDNGKVWMEVVLTEGRNREIRRIFEKYGILVDRIRRIAIGQLGLDDLETGSFIPLSDEDIKKIFKKPKDLSK